MHTPHRDGEDPYLPAAPYDDEAAALRSLPLGSYLAFNRLTGGSVAGKLF